MTTIGSKLRLQFQADLSRVTSMKEAENISVLYEGRNGAINKSFKALSKDPEMRKKEGAELNELKNYIALSLKTIQLKLRDKENFVLDPTVPGSRKSLGSIHPISIAVEEISRIFSQLGFIRMSYPEVEREYFSFESLNMPEGHAARDDFETSYLKAPKHEALGRLLLTPHTSSGQVREMWRVKTPPIRMINIAKCYRPNWDQTHTPMFFQFEGLCIDTGITISHLKGALEYFVNAYFGKREIRLRPFHFQFTEPSFEVDITCEICKGTGKLLSGSTCSVCKSGWLELGGTGMVHPHVLKEGKIDTSKYSGWAFGFGIERIIMMKYGISDIRNYYTGDIRFLKQF